MRIRIPLVLFLLAALALPAAAQRSSSLRTEVMDWLPATVGEVAYLDLLEIRRSPHYQQIRQRVIPPRFMDFDRFVRTLGVNFDTDIDWMAWALISSQNTGGEEQFLGIVQGRFREDRIRNIYAQNQLPLREYEGHTLYIFGDEESAESYSMVLLDQSTGAFGSRSSLETLIDTREGRRPSLQRDLSLSRQVGQVNGKAPAWVVMDAHYTQLAMRQLLPELARFEEFQAVADRLQSSDARIEVGREFSLNFSLECAQPADAQSLAFLLQTGLTAQGWQAQDQAPELGRVLNRAEVRSVGKTLRLVLLAQEEELRALLSKPVKLFP